MSVDVEQNVSGSAERRRAQRMLLILARLGATVTEAMHQRVQPAHASNVEILVLVSLDLAGPQRPADIIQLTGLTSGGVTKVLDRLEGQGLIERHIGQVDGDRRGTELVITPQGRHVAGELAAGLASQMDLVRETVEELRRTLDD